MRFVGGRMRRLRRLYCRAEPPLDTPAWRKWLALDPQSVVAAATGCYSCPTAHARSRANGNRELRQLYPPEDAEWQP